MVKSAEVERAEEEVRGRVERVERGEEICRIEEY